MGKCDSSDARIRKAIRVLEESGDPKHVIRLYEIRDWVTSLGGLEETRAWLDELEGLGLADR